MGECGLTLDWDSRGDPAARTLVERSELVLRAKGTLDLNENKTKEKASLVEANCLRAEKPRKTVKSNQNC